jgi:hypothetical protein
MGGKIPEYKTQVGIVVDKEDWAEVKKFIKKSGIKQSWLFDQVIRAMATVLREPEIKEILEKPGRLSSADFFFIISRFMREYDEEE